MCLVIDVIDELHVCDDWNLFGLMNNVEVECHFA